MGDAETVLEDVKVADTVVVGRIANYRIVTPDGKKPGLIWDYARFDIVIDEVLKGRASRVVTVTWDNSTFEEPSSILPGQYLIALRKPGSTSRLPLRGPSATIFARPEATLPTLLQAPCAAPFMFESSSKESAAVRRILLGSQRK